VRGGTLTADEGKLYRTLFDLRQDGDYATDHSLGAEDVRPLMDATGALVERLCRLARP
jgi:hypothetical protein